MEEKNDGKLKKRCQKCPDMIDKDGHNRFAETIIERVKTILEEVERKQLPEKDNW